MTKSFLIAAIVMFVLGVTAVATAMFLLKSKKGEDLTKIRKPLLACSFSGAGCILIASILLVVAALLP